MGEFSRSGPQMPTEQRRAAQAEHEQELRDAAIAGKLPPGVDPSPRQPKWKFWRPICRMLGRCPPETRGEAPTSAGS